MYTGTRIAFYDITLQLVNSCSTSEISRFVLFQCVDGQENDMRMGDVTAELLELLGSLIGGADVDFVSRSAVWC